MEEEAHDMSPLNTKNTRVTFRILLRGLIQGGK